MTTDKKVTQCKLLMLELATELQNVSSACEIMVYSRQQCYEILRDFQLYGVEGLLDKPPAAPPPLTPARGLLPDDVGRSFAGVNSPLEQLSAEAVRYRIAVDPQARGKTMTVRNPGAMVDEVTSSKPFTAPRDGFAINAATGCKARARSKFC